MLTVKVRSADQYTKHRLGRLWVNQSFNIPELKANLITAGFEVEM